MRRLACLVMLLAGGCAALGAVDDGTSLSAGWSNGGELINAVELPLRGDGYRVPAPWSSRRLNYGTEELVGVIVRAARRVSRESADAMLYVADLSPQWGGASAWHRSHQTGRDADLLFFAVDDAGLPLAPPPVMLPYHEGRTAPGTDGKVRHFDVARNWLLVRALLEDPAIDVQFLFIADPLRAMLLEQAVALGEPAELQARAALVLQQPGDSLPHDDHLHLRIYCPPGDRALGCRDRGPQRWFKKGWKYVEARAKSGTPAIELPPIGAMCRLIAPSLVAGR